MPGTRTAPTVDGTPPFKYVSYRFIDSTEDIRAVGMRFPAGATDLQIEAVANALQARTNASLFEVNVNFAYSSIPDVGNALAEVHISVFDNVVVLFKDQEDHSQNLFIPAPITALQPDDSDTPVASQLTTIILAVTNALEQGTTDDWQAVSARYTERREKNQRTFI